MWRVVGCVVCLAALSAAAPVAPGDSSGAVQQSAPPAVFSQMTLEVMHRPFTVEPNFHRANKPWHTDDAITLTIQCDLSRMGRVSALAQAWKGPVSVAVLTTPMERQKLEQLGSSNSGKLDRVSVAGVFSDSVTPYPINFMRNVALKGAKSKYVYVMDIDEDVGGSMEWHLAKLKEGEKQLQRPDKGVFVVSSFQWKYKDSGDSIPQNKDELRRKMNGGKAVVKHPAFRNAYEHPDMPMSKWIDINSPKKVKYVDWFEPYFMGRREQLPLFDDEFEGFGYNKHQHAVEMASKGFQFVILPDIFNFSDETEQDTAEYRQGREQGHRGTEAANTYWRELGHGCTCKPGECVRNCPHLFVSDEAKASTVLLATSSTTTEEAQPGL